MTFTNSPLQPRFQDSTPNTKHPVSNAAGVGTHPPPNKKPEAVGLGPRVEVKRLRAGRGQNVPQA